MTETNETQWTPGKALRRTWWHTLLLGSTVLVCGMVIGSALTVVVLSRRDMPPFIPPEEMPERITSDLRKELGLTDEQADAIRAIFTQGMAEVDKIRAEFEPKMDAHMDAVRKRVEAVLSPEQAKRWNARCEEMRQRVRPPRMLPPPPPREPRP